VDGREISGLILRLPGGGTIRGRILGITREEAAAVLLLAGSDVGEPAMAGMFLSPEPEPGSYRLENLAPGTWRIKASFPSGLHTAGTARLTAPGEEAVLDLEMPRGLTLSGQVLVDGAPLPDAQVQVMGSADSEVEGLEPPSTTTRHDGTFGLGRLRPGRLTLVVRARSLHDTRTLDDISQEPERLRRIVRTPQYEEAIIPESLDGRFF